MANTYTNILFHIIFSTKNRKPLITNELESRLYEYIGGIIRKNKGVLYEIGGTSDHVHLLVRWNTNAVSALTRELKSESTKWVRKTFSNHHFSWQEGYGIYSVSQSQVDTVCKYIRNQKEHHKAKTFKDEYLEFLEKNEIKYDMKYVFD